MTLHFAYGSNMSRARMGPRCPAAVAVGRAVLAAARDADLPPAYVRSLARGASARPTPRRSVGERAVPGGGR